MSETNFKQIGLEEGYQKAIDLLHRCSSPDGFLASPIDHSNYKRIWSRDGAIISLAALLSGDENLIATSKTTLQTLANHQGPHGEIPSNVDPNTERISYGGMAGRIDADLWFIIACGEYWLATNDYDFLYDMLPVIKKVVFLLGAWEFNNRGLLYIPQTGDWADEYLHHGYVLFDQLLYLQAKRTLQKIHSYIHQSTDHTLRESLSKLKHLIQANYWITDGGGIPDEVYHEVIYRKGLKASWRCKGNHWLPYFSPHGYGYRFDAFANVLVSLLDVANDQQREKMDTYLQNEIMDRKEIKLLPAFHPVITPIDDDWSDLQTMFSYSFKNKPDEYHNGGLWPMITGFYAADLAKRGKHDSAKEYVMGIMQANAMEMEGEAWGFPEYVHGTEYTPGGTRHQGWSAAGAIIGYQALQGKSVFRSMEIER